MQTYSVFMVWTTIYDSVSAPVIRRQIHTILLKITVGILANTDDLILKVTQKFGDARIA